MPFPLFRLPDLALIEVVKCLNRYEILNLNLSSIQARYQMSRCKLPIGLTIIVNNEKSITVRFELRGENEIKIVFRVTDLPEVSSQSYWKFKSIRLLNPYCGNTICQNLKHDFPTILDFFNTAFCVKSVSFANCFQSDPRQSIEVMDQILKRGFKLQKIEWASYYTDAFNMENVLTKAIDSPELFYQTPPGEKFDFSRFSEFTLNSLKVYGNFSMSANSLCALINCSKVCLRYANLDTDDYIRFMEFWVAEEGNIIFWEIGTQRDIYWPKIMESIPAEKIGEDEWRVHKANGSVYEVTFYSKHFFLQVVT